jgi:hypothetical protein
MASLLHTPHITSSTPTTLPSYIHSQLPKLILSLILCIGGFPTPRSVLQLVLATLLYLESTPSTTLCYSFSTQVLRIIILMTKHLVDMPNILTQVPFLQIPGSQKHHSLNSLDSLDSIQPLGQQSQSQSCFQLYPCFYATDWSNLTQAYFHFPEA